MHVRTVRIMHVYMSDRDYNNDQLTNFCVYKIRENTQKRVIREIYSPRKKSALRYMTNLPFLQLNCLSLLYLVKGGLGGFRSSRSLFRFFPFVHPTFIAFRLN